MNIKKLIITSILAGSASFASATSTHDMEVSIGKEIGNPQDQTVKEYNLPNEWHFFYEPGKKDLEPGQPFDKAWSDADKMHFSVGRTKFNNADSSRKSFSWKVITNGEFNLDGGFDFAAWGKLVLGQYPVNGYVSFAFKEKYETFGYRFKWGMLLSNPVESGDIETDNHYTYAISAKLNQWDGTSAKEFRIKTVAKYKDEGRKMYKMSAPYIHLSNMPDGYYLSQKDAENAGFNWTALPTETTESDQKIFNVPPKMLNLHLMTMKYPNKDGGTNEFHFQQCMPQSNLTYNVEEKTLSCELPSGLPKNMPKGYSSLYFQADGVAAVYHNSGYRPFSLSKSAMNNKDKHSEAKHIHYSRNLSHCKVGSLKFSNGGVVCEIDPDVHLAGNSKWNKNDGYSKGYVKILPNTNPIIN